MPNHNEHAIETDLQQADFAMSFEEIGQVLGMSRGTAWTIYHRGLRKLRRTYPGILSELLAASHELDRNRRAALTDDSTDN